MKRYVDTKGCAVLAVLVALTSLVAACEDVTMAMEEEYFDKLDSWVNRGGPSDELDETVLLSCGKLVVLYASTGQKIAFMTTRREAFKTRIAHCGALTQHRAYHEFEDEEVAAVVCDYDEDLLFTELCRRSGLR